MCAALCRVELKTVLFRVVELLRASNSRQIEMTAILNCNNLIFFRTAMLPDNLNTVQIEVAPGLALPAGAANFVFNRLHWISEGETGSFDIGAPSGWDFNDLCTLSFLLSRQEFSSA